jgi:hypothetical protein
MSALTHELPHPHPAECHEWLCEWCQADGLADHHDDVPAICPECASARIWSEPLCGLDDDDNDFMEEDHA